MERIQGRLEKTRVDSDMWKMAVRTGNFKVLQEIAASVQECAGPDLQVLDVKEFLSRFREAKELRDYLHEQFGKIKEDRENLFLMQEDFPAVIRLCNEMRNLPARRTLPSTGGDSWLAVSQEDYRQILHLADNELDFYDPFAEKQLAELSAEHKRSLLDELSALAVQRSADLQKWEKWQTTREQLYEDAKNLYSSASRPQGSIQDSLHKWNSVRESCKAAAAYLTMHPAPVSSYRAQEILEGAQTLVDDVEKWVANVEKTIGEHGELTSNIPAPEELIRLSRGSDYSRFAEALVRARFNGREKNVKEFTEHLGQNVLRKMKSPSLEELRRLYDFSERCLGTEDRITRVIAEAVAEKENPPKRGLWPFGRK